MTTNRYPVTIEWSDEDKEYVATCPAFPSLSAFGKTEEEALNEGKIALAGFIKTYRTNNMPLPEPVMQEVTSGKFQLRLPKSLHRLAVQMARAEGVSLNSYISDAVRAKVAGDQLGNRVINEVRQLLARTNVAASARTPTSRQPAKHDRVKPQPIPPEYKHSHGQKNLR